MDRTTNLSDGWTEPGGERRLVAVNYSGHDGQCRVRWPWPDVVGSPWTLRDQLSEAIYERDGTDLVEQGLFLDMQPWGHHVFEVAR